MQKACSNANISYENVFLKWANDSSKNFQAKNIAGLPRLSLDDLRKTEAVDGRNLAFFLESIGKRLDLHTKEHKSVRSDLNQAAKLVRLNLKKQQEMESKIDHLEKNFVKYAIIANQFCCKLSNTQVNW